MSQVLRWVPLLLGAVLSLCAQHALPPERDVERRFPAGTVIDPTQPPYGADRTGVADATAALQTALDAAAGRILWLPNGTYRISNTLRFPTTASVNCAVIGQSRTGVVVRLADGAAGFGDATVPRPMLATGLVDSGASNPDAFGRSVENLTLDTGNGNAGAIALHFYANNHGAARDLVLRSGDGQGHAGLDLGRARNNGPLLVQRVRIEGFDYGVVAGAQYGLGATLEHLTLTGQRRAGIFNQNQQISLRNVHASGQLGPSLWNTVGHVTLVDGSFVAATAASTQPAVRNEAAGQMLLRNVNTSGYARAVEDPSFPVSGAQVTEWFSDVALQQFTTAGRTLNLPVQEAPEVPYDDPSTWLDLTAPPYNCKDSNLNNNYDNAAAIQAAIDSGATTLYVPAGVFLKVKSRIFLRRDVRRLIGLGGGAAIVGDGTMADNATAPAVVLATGSAPAVVWESLHGGWGRALQLGNESNRTLIVRDSATQGGRFTGSGTVFLENVPSNPYTGFTFSGGGSVFARQLNPECDATKLTVNNGTRLWVLGLKTEKPKTVLDVSGGAQAEILGAFIFPIDSAAADTMFRISDARATLNFFEYLYGAAYGTLVSETQGGVQRALLRGAPDRPAAYERVTGAGFGSAVILYASVDELSGLAVRGLGQALASGDASPSLAEGTDFGTAQVGRTAVDRTFDVQNVGTVPVSFSTTPRVEISGTNAPDFTVLTDLPSTLEAGQAAQFVVRFSPGATGARSATLSMAHGAGGSPFTFSVAGTATAPAPIASFEPERLDLAVEIGGTRVVTFWIRNAGFSSLSGTLGRNTGPDYFAARSTEPGGPAANDWRTALDPVAIDGLAGLDDSVSATFMLPFSFPFHGSSYSRARVSTNGVLLFETADRAAGSLSNYVNGTIPTTSSSGPQIFAYWDDLYFRTGASGLPDARAVRGVVSEEPDACVVNFENISFYAASNASQRFTFQTVLRADGSVQLNYQTVAANGEYSVGLQGNSTNGLQLFANGTGTGVMAGESILFTPPAAWITAFTSTSGGTVQVPAQTSIAGSLTVSASGLAARRTYRSLIRLSGTNDPARPLLWLPVNLVVTATALEAWRYNNFGQTSAEGPAHDHADPDADGMSNLLEYALGGNPKVAGGFAPVLGTHGARATLTFIPVRSDVSYAVETSNDLVSWTSTSIHTPTLNAPFTFSDTVDLGTDGLRFLRLRVSMPSGG